MVPYTFQSMVLFLKKNGNSCVVDFLCMEKYKVDDNSQ